MKKRYIIPLVFVLFLFFGAKPRQDEHLPSVKPEKIENVKATEINEAVKNELASLLLEKQNKLKTEITPE